MPDLDRRVAYYMGAAVLLWVNWQICTIVGILIGSAVPDSLPLDFAVPLVFLVLLVPTITTRPAVVAAVVGGLVALFSAEFGPGPHGGAVRRRSPASPPARGPRPCLDRRAGHGAVDHTPLPPDPEPTL